MPAVLLVRHAQASYGSADYDVLSERGAEQAAALHAALSARGAGDGARLISGSLRRQRDTALPWTETGASLEIDERWDEYDAAGVLGAHGRAPASLESSGGEADQPSLSSRVFQGVLDEALHAWISAGDGGAAGESWPAFAARVGDALRDAMAALGSGETAIVFTSGGAIAACVARLLGVPDPAFVALNHVAVNGAVSKVVGGRRGLTLVSFNEHAHLEPGGLVTYR